MGIVGEHDSDSGVFYAPSLTYPTISGITPPLGTFDIPMLITSYSPVDYKTTVNIGTVLPAFVSNNSQPIGTNVVLHGVSGVPRLSIEGTIDTPCVLEGSAQLPNVIANGVFRLTWADFIVMCLEGRASEDYARVDPISFRDPYGRVYLNPRVLDFTANYVEAVPGRTNFTMQLKV